MEVAVDTNPIVRYVTRDDPVQEKQARRVFLENAVFVPKTVLMETEWVLRLTYRYPPDRIADALTMLVDTDRIRVEDPEGCRKALAAFRRGLNFADALHSVACTDIETFATFDKPLLKRAPRASATPRVVAP